MTHTHPPTPNIQQHTHPSTQARLLFVFVLLLEFKKETFSEIVLGYLVHELCYMLLSHVRVYQSSVMSPPLIVRWPLGCGALRCAPAAAAAEEALSHRLQCCDVRSSTDCSAFPHLTLFTGRPRNTFIRKGAACVQAGGEIEKHCSSLEWGELPVYMIWLQ